MRKSFVASEDGLKKTMTCSSTVKQMRLHGRRPTKNILHLKGGKIGSYTLQNCTNRNGVYYEITKAILNLRLMVSSTGTAL